MTNLIGILHIFAAFILIILVLIQDSKSDGALGMGGSSGSNSLLGATGAQSLAGKLTVWVAVIFAITCLSLSVFTSSHSKSVVDSLPLPAPAAMEGEATATPAPAADASGDASPSEAAPAN